jgi:hypothetical protein
MLARALGVTFRQALRSVALTLFPLAFIALFTWATAGSTSGNTSDPIRATAWLWLASHCVPFLLHSQSAISASVQVGQLSQLPLTALLFPLWALRRSFGKVREILPHGFGAQLIFALWYALFATLLALASYSDQVSASIFYVPAFTFLFALAATSTLAASALAYLKFALNGFLALLGVAALIYSVSLAEHWSIVKSIGIVITPGIFGGLLFTLIQILYLPNFAIATLGYLTGAGFTFGAHTQIAPTHFQLNGISAIPALGALPTGKHPLLQYGVALWPIFLIVVILFMSKRVKDFKTRQLDGIATLLLFTALIALFGYLAQGELLTPSLRPVGVQWLRLTEVVGASSIAALICALYLPRLFSHLRPRFGPALSYPFRSNRGDRHE